MILSYPLQLHPSRRCVMNIVKAIQEWIEESKENPIEAETDYTSRIDSNLSLASTTEEGMTGNKNNILAISQNIENEINQPLDQPLLRDDSNVRTNESNRLFYLITIIFLSLSYTIAMIVDDLGIVLGVVGATGSTMLSYILPGILYVKLHPEKHMLRNFAFLQFGLGVLIVPTSLCLVLLGKAHG